MPQFSMVFRGQDAWRRHPLFNGHWKDPFPGIRPAILIFGVYLGVEYMYKSVTTPKRVPRFKPKGIADSAHH